MYKPHNVFKQPENENIPVWRYMDFTKFVSLIDTKCLFFARADKLGDPFEGSWAKPNVLSRTYVPSEVPPEHRETFLKSMAALGIFKRHTPRFIAINCWHMNEHESAAMWKLYLKSNEGIAVQSTYRKLKESLTDDEEIFLGVVKYINYDNEIISPGSNLLSCFFHKRKSFEHEREVRAVVNKLPDDNNLSRDVFPNGGIKISVDLELLIEKVYVAPTTPNWFSDLVKAVLRRYGYKFQVVNSRLNEQPIY